MSKPASAAKRSFPVWPVLIGAIVVAGILAVVLTSGGDDDNDTVVAGPGEAGESAAVTVTGEPLPIFEETRDDPAVGEAAPILAGSNFAGDPVTIPSADGNAKAIFFVAHWCPHCRDEIPRLSEWLKTHDLPAGVEIDIVSTRVNESPVNYPPSAWLAARGSGISR